MRLLDPELEFRLAKLSDAEAFCSLSNSLYPRKVSEEYYRWQFFETPFDAFVVTGWDGRDLVAAFGVHVTEADQRRRAMSLDIMVAPRLQGRGLISELASRAWMEASRRGASLIGVVANDRAKRALEARAGWHTVREVFEWSADCLCPEPSSIVVTELVGPPLYLASSGHDFYPRTERVLRWRTRTPRYVHTWIEFSRGERCLGSAVVKEFRDPVTARASGDILDLFLLRPTDEVEVLHAIRGWFHNKGLDHCAACPKSEADEAFLSMSGFHRTSRLRYYCSVAPSADSYSIGMLDIDIY